MREWIKLKSGNDWGYEFVMLPDCPSAIRGTSSRKDEIKIPEDSKIRVIWENEVHECETFNIAVPGGTVSDHGHPCPYSGNPDIPYVFLGKRPRKLTDLEINKDDLFAALEGIKK